MKTLRIAVLCFAPVLMSGKQQASAQKQTPNPNPETPTFTSGSYYDQSSHYQDKNRDSPNGWHKFVTWPESWTAWAIIATLGAIAYQSYWTRRSVQVLASHERPWILIEGISFDEPATTPLRNGKYDSEAFHYTLKNYGRTPARIVALASRVDIGESPEFPPHPSVYSLKDFVSNPHVIPQQDDRPHHASLPEPLSQKDYLLILSGQAFVWACAIVRYEDVHGNRFETRVCYRNDPQSNKISVLRLDGPAEYNNAT